jgi:hypothetical protein
MPVDSSDSLIRAAIVGDVAAWTQLVEQALPRIRSIIAAHKGMRTRGLAASSDDVAEVTTATLERLSRDGMRNLKRYVAQREQAAVNEPQSFDSWLYGATDFAIREHLRQRYGRAPKVSDDTASGRPMPNKRALGTDADVLDEARHRDSVARAIGITTNLTLAEIFAFVNDEFEADEARAIQLHYFKEVPFTELACELGLADATAAEQLIRRLNARLRYRFVAKS